MTIIISRVINLFSIFVFDILFHVVTFWVNFSDVGDATLTLIPDWKFWQSVMNIMDERRGKWTVLLSNCASRHMTLYRFHQIQVNITIF